jgi:hypothetical protein
MIMLLNNSRRVHGESARLHLQNREKPRFSLFQANLQSPQPGNNYRNSAKKRSRLNAYERFINAFVNTFEAGNVQEKCMKLPI